MLIPSDMRFVFLAEEWVVGWRYTTQGTWNVGMWALVQTQDLTSCVTQASVLGSLDPMLLHL